MALFLTDLDNTLIYSYKRDIGLNKLLVETKEGKELSFMTQYTADCLSILQEKLRIIPLTTRSVSQYQRISFPKPLRQSLALAANGGILLVDGAIDEEWLLASKKIAESAFLQMEKGRAILSADENVYTDVVYVDNLFIFTKSKIPALTLAGLYEKLNLDQVSIHENGEKIYILPKALHKGKAVERIRERFAFETIVCAGDSIFDIPMLIAADIGYYPQELNSALQKVLKYSENLPNAKLQRINKAIFSDGFLKQLLSRDLGEECRQPVD